MHAMQGSTCSASLLPHCSCDRSWISIQEVFRYHYRSDGLVDYVDVYSPDSSYLRRDQYFYNTGGELSRIKHLVQNGQTWKYNYDYGFGRPGISGDPVDVTRYVGDTYTYWGWNGGNVGFGYETVNSNVSRLWFKDRDIYFDYDDHKNPLSPFKSSRPLPARFSANNPTKIQAMAVHPDGSLPNIAYSANLSYTYGNDGLPLMAIKAYEHGCIPPDTLRYVYDKIER